MVRLLLVLTLPAFLCVSANAQSIRVEAESYVASYDQGGVVVNVTPCSGASGGYAVEGFDFPGDWIEVVVNIPEDGTFADSLRSGGLVGQESDLESTVFGAGPAGEDLVSVFHTMGYGIG